MKDKTHCLTCKDKKANKLKSLTDVPVEDIKKAYEYISIASTMNEEKWDFVEEVFKELYPTAAPLNRKCGSCLRNVAKSITYEYNKIKK